MKEITIKRRYTAVFPGFKTIGNEHGLLAKDESGSTSSAKIQSTNVEMPRVCHSREFTTMRRKCNIKRRRSPIKMLERHRDSERFRHQGLNATMEYLANRVPGYNNFTFSKTKVVKMQLMINYICHLESYVTELCNELNCNTFSRQSFLSYHLLQGHRTEMKWGNKERRALSDDNEDRQYDLQEETSKACTKIADELHCSSHICCANLQSVVAPFMNEMEIDPRSSDCSLASIFSASSFEASSESLECMTSQADQNNDEPDSHFMNRRCSQLGSVSS